MPWILRPDQPQRLRCARACIRSSGHWKQRCWVGLHCFLAELAVLRCNAIVSSILGIANPSSNLNGSVACVRRMWRESSAAGQSPGNRCSSALGSSCSVNMSRCGVSYCSLMIKGFGRVGALQRDVEGQGLPLHDCKCLGTNICDLLRRHSVISGEQCHCESCEGLGVLMAHRCLVCVCKLSFPVSGQWKSSVQLRLCSQAIPLVLGPSVEKWHLDSLVADIHKACVFQEIFSVLAISQWLSRVF